MNPRLAAAMIAHTGKEVRRLCDELDHHEYLRIKEGCKCGRCLDCVIRKIMEDEGCTRSNT